MQDCISIATAATILFIVLMFVWSYYGDKVLVYKNRCKQLQDENSIHKQYYERQLKELTNAYDEIGLLQKQIEQRDMMINELSKVR